MQGHRVPPSLVHKSLSIALEVAKYPCEVIVRALTQLMGVSVKAAVQFDVGVPLRVVEGVTLPSLRSGQVKVELAFSGVCQSQVMEVRGGRGEDKYLPHLLGHEATGIVREIGDQVTKVAVGQRVVLGWIRGSGLEEPGAIYEWQGQKINSGGVTTFSEFTVVSENRLTLMPEGMPMDVGVLFGCAIPTGAGLALNEVQIESHHSVVVFGIGGIGSIALMFAASKGPKKLIAIDTGTEKLDFAIEAGATHVINAARSDVLQVVRDLTDGHGADICLDAAGKTATIELAFKAVRRKGGQCVFASHPIAGDTIEIDPFELINGKALRGSWGGSAIPDRDVPRFFQIGVDSNINLSKMIATRYKLDDINLALNDLEAGKVMRPVIEINPNL